MLMVWKPNKNGSWNVNDLPIRLKCTYIISIGTDKIIKSRGVALIKIWCAIKLKFMTPIIAVRKICFYFCVFSWILCQYEFRIVKVHIFVDRKIYNIQYVIISYKGHIAVEQMQLSQAFVTRNRHRSPQIKCHGIWQNLRQRHLLCKIVTHEIRLLFNFFFVRNLVQNYPCATADQYSFSTPGSKIQDRSHRQPKSLYGSEHYIILYLSINRVLIFWFCLNTYIPPRV